ncbi:MAG: ABC transporter ATP-binding protein, partial [Georgenia sp.]
DHLLVIGKGRIITAGPVQDVIDSATAAAVRVRTPQAADLAALVRAAGATVASTEAGVLDLHGLTAEQVGQTAAAHGIVLHELTPQRASLEEAYMSLTQDAVEYRSETMHAEDEIR